MKKRALIISIFVLTGCTTDSVAWFWNNGFGISDKELKIYYECLDIAEKQMRPNPNKWVGDKDQQEWLGELTSRAAQVCREKREN